MSNFLPENYEPPASGNYLKFQIGDNRFRVLGPAIVGNMFWTTDHEGNRKPVRRRTHETIRPDELGYDQHGKPERPKHFWCFPVWNYQAKSVQIAEVTQRGIQDAIRALAESGDWGNPTGYDLIVKRSGSGMETDYQVMPGRPSPIAADIQREYIRVNPDMEALYRGDDPFANSGQAQPPQATQAPPADHRPQLVRTAIREVGQRPGKSEGRDVTVYTLVTHQGEFATIDDALGGQAVELVNTGEVEITFIATGKGRKVTGLKANSQPMPTDQPQASVDDFEDLPF